ncbi:hypothetical protein SK128_011986 [Halocaridina rubra]|uniref:Uncharacterized protein n=1 Tax=Halocaridina rubra TaxID=373956 RepID=A0AAN8ZZU3_HALRR
MNDSYSLLVLRLECCQNFIFHSFVDSLKCLMVMAWSHWVEYSNIKESSLNSYPEPSGTYVNWCLIPFVTSLASWRQVVGFHPKSYGRALPDTNFLHIPRLGTSTGLSGHTSPETNRVELC